MGRARPYFPAVRLDSVLGQSGLLPDCGFHPAAVAQPTRIAEVIPLESAR